MKAAFRITLSIGLAGVMSAGCSTMHKSSGDAGASAEAAIREADANWSKVAESNNFEGFLSYYASDAQVLPPDAPMAAGSEAIRKTTKPYFDGNSVLRWQADRVEAARSGELGYVQGSYTITMKDPKAKPAVEHGKFLEVWRRQSNGSWKCIMDMFSADQPPGKP